MSEKMQVKNGLEPCAWCGSKPYLFGPQGNQNYRCDNDGCIGSQYCGLNWNEMQGIILARRRADYIEGCRAADAVAYYEPFDVEASADAYLSQPPADGER